MGYFAQCSLVVTMIAQGLEKLRHPCYITEIQRHDGPIKIGAEGYMSDADALGNIVDVAYNFRNRRIRFPPAVLPGDGDLAACLEGRPSTLEGHRAGAPRLRGRGGAGQKPHDGSGA